MALSEWETLDDNDDDDDDSDESDGAVRPAATVAWLPCCCSKPRVAFVSA